MTITLDIEAIVFALTHPSYWSRNSPYSEAWNQELIRLMDGNTFEPVTQHTVRLGGILLWIGNHPYASMQPHDGPLPELSAKRITIYRAWQKMQKDIFEHYRKQQESKV